MIPADKSVTVASSAEDIYAALAYSWNGRGAQPSLDEALEYEWFVNDVTTQWRGKGKNRDTVNSLIYASTDKSHPKIRIAFKNEDDDDEDDEEEEEEEDEDEEDAADDEEEEMKAMAKAQLVCIIRTTISAPFGKPATLKPLVDLARFEVSRELFQTIGY